MRNKLISFFLALILLAALTMTAAAQEFDPNQQGSISVLLVSQSGDTPMAGAELSVFHVADAESGGDGKLMYHYTAEFANCGIPLEDSNLAGKLDAYVTAHAVDCRRIVTDARGKAVCENLPVGLYFVKQTGQAEGFATCASFLVTVPLETDAGFVYHVDATPKTDAAKLIDITIRKVWNTDKSTPASEQVTVQLLRDEIVVDTAVLNEQNGWQVIYRDLPESDAYRIKEVNVPRGLTATYSRSGYLFTVTNTSTLAQTGQMVWPVPVFAMAGMIFLLMGFAILRKTGEHHA